MYDTIGQQPMAETCKEPDWEAEAAQMTKNLKVIQNFKTSLIAFIDVVGTHSIRRRDNGSSLAELLGTVEIDIIERGKALNRVLEKLEKKSK